MFHTKIYIEIVFFFKSCGTDEIESSPGGFYHIKSEHIFVGLNQTNELPEMWQHI